MSAEELRKTILATLAKIRDGAAQMVEGIDELLKQHEESVVVHEMKPSITQDDLDLLPWVAFKSGSGGWTFVEPPDPREEPEEVTRTRERVVAYVRAKGGSASVGKWRLSISRGTRGDVEFLRRTPVAKREKQA